MTGVQTCALPILPNDYNFWKYFCFAFYFWSHLCNPRETCRVLLKNGAEVFQMDARGFTALHHAVEAGSLQTVKILLDCRLPSTLERVDLSNNTPLHIACMHNRPDILSFLLDQGANVTAKNKRNMTCLDVAVEWEASEVAMTLMRHPRFVK